MYVAIFARFLTKFGISWQIFTEVPNNKFHINPPSEGRADADRQTDMTKLMDAYRDYANAPIMTGI